ncbi:hypothetical protein [Kingella potus]|nr:hypothetical protein [Kingella potus]UOP00153.1 hypothetical protein LVJ84_09390 [Kingella potus]
MTRVWAYFTFSDGLCRAAAPYRPSEKIGYNAAVFIYPFSHPCSKLFPPM